MYVGTIMMDNDSTPISKARSEMKTDLKKQCDINHLLKDFTHKLYDIRKAKNFKEPKGRVKVFSISDIRRVQKK